MKFRARNPEPNSTVYQVKFAWLPVVIGGEAIWLEKYGIRKHYRPTGDGKCEWQTVSKTILRLRR